jgi:hypothetical protein
LCTNSDKKAALQSPMRSVVHNIDSGIDILNGHAPEIRNAGTPLRRVGSEEIAARGGQFILRSEFGYTTGAHKFQRQGMEYF